jgi:hypothetical protein
MSDKKSSRGRPALPGQQIKISFRLRQGRSQAEDALISRLDQLPPRHRSRFIRRVLTTGDIDAVLDREFERETGRVTAALDAMAGLWDDDDDDLGVRE